MTPEGPPLLRIVAGGEPTAEELAAVVVALTSRSRPPERPVRASAWADRAQLLRRPLRHGPDRWRRGGAGLS